MTGHSEIERTWWLNAPTEPASTIENATRRLRAAIILGELEPGRKLVESELSRELGVSRASMREVLRVLATERLVDLVPNRGPSVCRLTPQDVDEIHDVWAMLTSEIVSRFTAMASEADIAELRIALSQLQRAVQSEEPHEQLAAINRFFAVIMARYGNSALQEMVITLVLRINVLRSRLLKDQKWRQLHGKEIMEIAKEIEARRPDAARQATLRHIDSVCAAAREQASASIVLPLRNRIATRRSKTATDWRRRIRSKPASPT